MPRGVRGIERTVPFQTKMVGVITVVLPDGAGVPQQKLKIHRIMRFIIEIGEVTDENAFELRHVAALALAGFTRFPQYAVLVNQRGDGRIGDRRGLRQIT